MTPRTILMQPATALAAVLLAGTTATQSCEPQTVADILATVRVPIHSHGGDYGHWAVGVGYKASFHDGFAFHPFLDESQPAALPLRWTTEAVTVGGATIADLRRPPAHVHTDWRYEYRWSGLVERYDVRTDGVEQSFVIDERPAAGGDLVVTGRFDTLLRAAALPAAAHAPLSFCEPRGRACVRYGAAFALDARGRRLALETGFDGARVRIAVPWSWLASAEFPIVIDPLTSPVSGLKLTSGVRNTQIARDPESSTRNTMITFHRLANAQDDDAYAVLVDDDFANPALVFADVDAARSASSPSVAYVEDADRWVLSWTSITLAGFDSRLHLYFHDRANAGRNSGLLRTIDPNPRQGYKYPRLSPPVSGTTALLVWGTGGSLSSYDVWAGLLDARTASLGTTYRINPTTRAGFAAAVASQPGPQERSWIVAWDGVSRTDPLDDWDVYVTRVDPSAFGFGLSFEVPDGSTAWHERDVTIDGRDGRYLIAAMRGVSFYRGRPTQTLVQRLDWPQTAPLPSFGEPRILDAQPDITGDLRLAFDHDSRSHWFLAYRRFIELVTPLRRLGYTGGVVEEFHTNHASGVGAYYHSPTREFRIAFGDGSGLAAQRMVYPADALSVRSGSGCQQSSLAFGTDAPYAGSEFFGIRFGGIGGGKSCVLLMSLAPASISLNMLGMTGCVLGIDPGSPHFLAALPRVSAAGGIRVALPLPDAPVFRGDLWGQWLYQAHRGANPAGVLASWPIRIQVR